MENSFVKTVRIFARQCTAGQRANAFGTLSQYANSELMKKEKEALGKAMTEKHKKLSDANNNKKMSEVYHE